MKYIRIYADASGETHFADVEVELLPVDFVPPAGVVSLSAFSPALRYAFCTFPVGWRGDWHCAPCRQILFHLSGEAEVTVSDGETRRVGTGSAILVEDTVGKGHFGRIVSQGDLLTVIVQLPE